jgi:diaminohydroxyphosphoribosylaminopyrimidine deaminase/5-amino-6-(5-phosphoribosylamino)uracil reductase
MSNDIKFMRQCLELARKGRRRVSPNPMVGCVIVKEGRVVGEGYHRKFGGMHAEIHALRKAGRRARGSTLYVNLEPCAHHGKTPPCTDAIIASGVKKVVMGMRDPNPLVSGRGVRRLRATGIVTRVGILANDAAMLNETFTHFMKSGLPFVSVKLAQTLDGKIADFRGNSRWISSAASRRVAHELRSEHHAVLVGANTVRVDNPLLTVRSVKGRNPLRVVVDGRLSLPPGHKVFRTGDAQTIVVTSARAARRKPSLVKRLQRQGVRVLIAGRGETLRPREILTALGREGISSLLIEGGGETVGLFLEAGLVQRLYCFVSTKVVGSGVGAWNLLRRRTLSSAIRFRLIRSARIGEDVMIEAIAVSTR